MTTRPLLLAPLLLLTLLLGLAAPAAASTHDGFFATLRLPPHGACTLAKSDAEVHATLACRDGHRARVRPCPREDSRRCFWHAPTRGNGEGRSFLVWAGRTTYLRA